MELKYGVYYVAGTSSSEPIIYYGESYPLTRAHRKYAGKKVVMKAIELHTGVILDARSTTSEVNAYVNKHFFKTSQWKKFRDLFRKIANVEVELRYFLKVEISDSVCTPDDERLIFLIKQDFLNNRIEEHNGLPNPICSISILE